MVGQDGKESYQVRSYEEKRRCEVVSLHSISLSCEPVSNFVSLDTIITFSFLKPVKHIWGLGGGKKEVGNPGGGVQEGSKKSRVLTGGTEWARQ